MEINVFDQGDVRVVETGGRIDSTTSAEFGQRLTDLIAADATPIVIDFSGVLYLSSAGLRALLLAKKQSDQGGCRLVLCGLGDEVARVFDVAGFSRLFAIYATRDEGLRAVG